MPVDDEKPQAARPKVDYLSHDVVYRHRRAQGHTGWDDPENLQQTLTAIDAFLRDVHFPPDPTLIELGCGAGDLALHYAARGFRVTVIDIAPFAIDWARQKAAAQGLNAAFIVADLTHPLERPLPTADLVLDGHCLHCIIGSDRAAFLQNARRCLKPASLFHVNTMCGHPHPPYDCDFDPASRTVIRGDIATRYFGAPESILQEVTNAGFAVERHQVIPAQYPGDEDCLLINARRPSPA